MPYLNSTRILMTFVKPNTMIATMNAHINGLLLVLQPVGWIERPCETHQPLRDRRRRVSRKAHSPTRCAFTNGGFRMTDDAPRPRRSLVALAGCLIGQPPLACRVHVR